MTEIGNPFSQTGTAGLQDSSENFSESLEVPLVFGRDPLTQLVLQLTIQKGCFHEICFELGNLSVS